MGDKINSDNKKAEEPTAEEDEELSALLDSAVADFDKGEKTDALKPVADEKSKESTSVKPTPPDTLWTDDYMRSNAGRVPPNIASLFSPGPDGSFNMEQLGQEISRLAEATTQAAGFETSPDQEFSAIIAETLRNLSQGTDDIQNQFSEEDLINMLGSLGNLPDGESDPGELMPFMQKMMQNLMSKEILHPALSSIIERYPSWIEENRGNLPAEDISRYEKQLSTMQQVCVELETESSTDSDSVKKTRFDKVLGLMQEMQDCGQPPAELVGEVGPVFDEQGRPQMPPGMSPEQCVIQ